MKGIQSSTRGSTGCVRAGVAGPDAELTVKVGEADNEGMIPEGDASASQRRSYGAYCARRFVRGARTGPHGEDGGSTSPASRVM